MHRETPAEHPTADEFRTDEAFAREMDQRDPLAKYRDRFHIPKRTDGTKLIYLAGNSLGLQPKTVQAALEQELRDWADLGVDAHFKGEAPWYRYHQNFRESGARLVGALPGEVVLMNGLTVNLHLMMITFYRPTSKRFKIIMEDTAFPSDTYAAKTQLRHHGIDPNDGLIVIAPREGESTLRTEDIEGVLQREGHSVALLLLAGVQYFTGQLFDMAHITAAAKTQGCIVGWDLAHAAGNVPLNLHEWGVDFAVWCNYKYLNGGPGAIAGCFVHETHGLNTDLPRLGGWWGNDPDTRFRMHLQPEFVPASGAEGWQVSNPPILAMAPVAASYAMFDEVGMSPLRAKSLLLSGYLRYLIDQLSPRRFEIITPSDPAERGCQLSIVVRDRPRELLSALQAEGVICDYREPDVIRAAPVPMYNTFHEVWAFAQILARHDRES